MLILKKVKGSEVLFGFLNVSDEGVMSGVQLLEFFGFLVYRIKICSRVIG